MVLKFPSGKVSISYGDLQSNQQSQSTCGVCNKPWVIESDGCIRGQLHVLHPCQHLVGSGCWSSVPDEHIHKCPVCKVEVQSDERVEVHSASRESEVDVHAQAKRYDIRAQVLIVENKMKEGLSDADLNRMIYYMHVRAFPESITRDLASFLAATTALTSTHRERLVLFLANTTPHKHESKQRKVEIVLSAFNISRGTNFTIDDLRLALSSAEWWIKLPFSAILENNEKATKKASAVQNLEKTLADVEAEYKELKVRQSRENAQRLDGEIELAIEEIARKADEDIAQVNAGADEEIAGIRADASERVERALLRAERDTAKLQSHGEAMLKK